jgi:small subunit ribosomal protein S1
MSQSRNYWDQFEESNQESQESSSEGQKGKASEDASFASMFEASFKGANRKLKVGMKIRAEILSIGSEWVFVSTGTMNDGEVQRRELLDAEGQFKARVGDVLDLYVTSIKGSEVKLSPSPTAKNLSDDLQEAYRQGMALEGRVAEVCNGGFRVSLGGKLAFCPISQMDTRRIETPEDYVGKKFAFRVTQITEGGRNIVVSRRRLLEAEEEASQSAFFAEHKIGDVIRGKVKRLEKFGAFIEISPSLEGLAHISELSWSRVNDPSELLTVGQEVSVKVLKIEREGPKVRVSLSIKQATAQPWENLPSHIQVGQVVEGRVTRCVKFGAFVQLAPGVEGLIPLSEMSYTKRVMQSDELVKEGEKILVMIKELSPETKRIGLSLKDAGQDPWALIQQKFPVGAVVKGVVERREPYGLFVRLEDGITGLLPKSKALEQPEFLFEKLKIGEEAVVQVAELRPEERRISLQVPKDPDADEWRKYSQKSQSSFGTLADQLKSALEKKPLPQANASSVIKKKR